MNQILLRRAIEATRTASIEADRARYWLLKEPILSNLAKVQLTDLERARFSLLLCERSLQALLTQSQETHHESQGNTPTSGAAAHQR